MGLACLGDYDNDGWPDLYVANDAGPNFLYRNKHDGHSKSSVAGGAALSTEGQELGSMGVDFGDFDHDGFLDITVTNFAEQVDNLYITKDRAKASSKWLELENGQPVYPYVKWERA